MSREWDAAAYDRLPLPQDGWGERTLAQLTLRGDERVLDVGCGTGRDVARLLDRLPDGRVVALDGSREMLARVRERLAGRLDRVEIVHADLERPLPAFEPVDAVVSVAALHWVPDRGRVLGELARVLRPGGQLSIDCGGRGNVATVARALEELEADPPPGDVWTFVGPEETHAQLVAAGFVDVDARLVDEPADLRPGDELEAYLATVVLGPYLDRLPAGEQRAFVRAVADRLPAPQVDYVRLRATARRG